MRHAGAALALALLVVGVALAVPASRPAAAADLTGLYGGNLRVALLQAPSWDPLSTNPDFGKIHSLVWDSLARADPVTGEPEPWAAESWTVDTVARTITVTPRAGLLWSDGTAITLADLDTTFTQSGFSTSVSGSTLVFDFSAGLAGGFYSVALFAPIAWKSTTAIAYSGMFYRDTVDPTLLRTNIHYWAGRPYVDSVTLVVTTLDDAACRLLKSRSPGFTQGVDFLGFPLLPNDQTDERQCPAYGGFTDPQTGQPVNKSLVNANASRSEPHVSAVHHPGPRFMYYWLNVAGGGVMGDVNFRRALYLMVNKQLAMQIEPSSTPTHSLISRENTFWFLSSWEVVRDAGFTTIRDPGGTPRQDTNPFWGAQALDMAGYLDRDGDGWRQTPTGAAFSLDIGVVGFNVDPRKTTIVGAYVDVLSRQGVNANLVTFTSWTDLRNAVTAGTVDIALDTADAATANPRFMESFTPMTGAADPNTALHLDLGRNAMTLTERRLHFNHVTYYNSLAAAVLPVLHYQTLEVYDRDAYSGWVESFGGINNVWSFGSVRAPHLGPLTVSITPFTKTVTSGGQTTVAIVVADANGAAVQDAAVELSASAGTLGAMTGVTDANGRFQTTWQAPAVDQDADATIAATVTKPQYSGAIVSTSVTAHAPFRPLDVAVTVGSSVLAAGTSTSVEVRVTSTGGAGVPDAAVTLTLSLPGGSLLAYTGTTDSSGVFTTTFTATPTVRSIYRIDAAASKTGYESRTGTGSVIVSAPPIDPEDYQTVDVTQNVPGFEALLVIGALGAAVAVLRWRNRREG